MREIACDLSGWRDTFLTLRAEWFLAGMAGLGGIAGFLLGIVAKSFFGLLIVGLAVLAYFF